MDSEPEKDIFMIAAEKSLKDNPPHLNPNIVEVTIEEAESGLVEMRTGDSESVPSTGLVDEGLEIAEGMGEFEALRTAMAGRFSRRMVRSMDGLPDRDFVVAYLKVADYIFPKQNRVHGGSVDKTENTVKIEVVRSDKNTNK